MDMGISYDLTNVRTFGRFLEDGAILKRVQKAIKIYLLVEI